MAEALPHRVRAQEDGQRGKKPHNERSARASTATREEGVHQFENWTRGHEAARGLVRAQDNRSHLSMTKNGPKSTVPHKRSLFKNK